MTAKFINAKQTPPPKDGTLLFLLVKILDDDEWHPTEDSSIFRTIGFNSLGDTAEDLWQCGGWCWCCDEFKGLTFTESDGKMQVLGWANLPEISSDLQNILF